ncbi:serine--tRNA ligase [Thermogemmatispora aurantia]|jgi:seryl-tRNA synthetase|uniref:Serine--tRNA ligase n=1 Tax=Thermogemmatispora aurantia TaxID=2045279 RepID=A0A5J4K2U7_9CHLR|nr:aminoacyl--tRNA ligase-related protein [Thermogemmatispora aurantia]GER81975.1 serine--tRNA ligase [Thermogemmatispora aurantia]
MLSLDLLRQHPDLVRKGLQKRQVSVALEEIVRLAEQRDGLARRCEGLYGSLKNLREQCRAAPVSQRARLEQQITSIGEEIRTLELQIADLETHLRLSLLPLPNLPHSDVPTGFLRSANRELRRWGVPMSFYFPPRSYRELGSELGILDSVAGSRLSGNQFMVVRGPGARLLRALVTFALDFFTHEWDYREVQLPLLMKYGALLAAGQFPPLETQSYSCQADELYLNPGGATSLVNLYSDMLLTAETMPVRLVTWTPVFHRDGGSASLPPSAARLPWHQLSEVQLLLLVAPNESYTVLQTLLFQIETLLQRLELAYRVVMLCSGQLPFAAAMTLTIEAWLPAQRRFLPLASMSNHEGFLTRRANIRYRSPAGQIDYPHSLGACALSIEQTLATILEVYQQADGSVVVPKVLRPMMGLSLLTSH